MKTSDAFPSRYLQTAAIKDKPTIATISHLEMETVGFGADAKRKPVLYLDGQKPMVLNRTNFERIGDAFGDSDEWPGHKIKIYVERTSFGGKPLDGLRVQAIVPKPAAEPDFEPDHIPAL